MADGSLLLSTCIILNVVISYHGCYFANDYTGMTAQGTVTQQIPALSFDPHAYRLPVPSTEAKHQSHVMGVTAPSDGCLLSCVILNILVDPLTSLWGEDGVCQETKAFLTSGFPQNTNKISVLQQGPGNHNNLVLSA
jgi:hypothetical protein